MQGKLPGQTGCIKQVTVVADVKDCAETERTIASNRFNGKTFPKHYLFMGAKISEKAAHAGKFLAIAGRQRYRSKQKRFITMKRLRYRGKCSLSVLKILL